LRADLREAEEAMVAIESGLRGVYSRADAVSTLAESRIAVERASQNVPWRGERVLDAQQKIEAPVFIFGNARSGTTLLHSLMSLDEERFASMKLYQSISIGLWRFHSR